MAKVKLLTRAKIESLGPGKHPHGGVPGLVLVKGATGSTSWVWRCMVRGTRFEMGLGSFPRVGIDEAAEEARKWARVAKTGGDPIAQRKAEQAGAEEVMTVTKAIDGAFAKRQASLRNTQDGRWRSPLKMWVEPVIGDMPITAVDRHVIKRVLDPIWVTQHDTAIKALNRLRMAMVAAAAVELPVKLEEANPKLIRELMDDVVVVRKPHPAMPVDEVPEFHARLQGANTGAVAPRAIRLLILTATRWGSVQKATIDQFDLENPGGAVWTIPAENMKGKAGKVEAFRVPLPPAAVAVVRECVEAGLGKNGELFPGRDGGPANPTLVQHWMQRHCPGCVAHGFRTSFRTWCQKTRQDWELAERSLAHVVGTAVERAYAREDMLEQRRPLMNEWAAFVTG